MEKYLIKDFGENDYAREPIIKKFNNGVMVCLFLTGGRTEPEISNVVKISRSFDDGKTWMKDTLYLDRIGWYSDIAIDEKNGRVYVLHEDASVTDGRKMCMELFVFSFYGQFGKKRKGETI